MKPGKFVPVEAIFTSKDRDRDDVLFRSEQTFLVLLKTPESKEVYDNFTNQLQVYCDKISGLNKDVVEIALKHDIVYIGVSSKRQNNILSSIIDSGTKLMAIVLDSAVLDIDTITGDIGDLDEVLNQIYYQFVRVCAEHNIDQLKKDDKFNANVIEYYTFLILKHLKLPPLTDKKVALLKYLIGILYYKSFLSIDIDAAKDKVLKLIDNSFQDEIQNSISDNLISKYKDMKDILKLLVDTKITFDNPNNLTYQLLSNLKVLPFLSITTRFEYLIAAICTSLYSQDHYKSLLVNRNLQTSIEKTIAPLFNKLHYDSITKYHIKSVQRVANG